MKSLTRRLTIVLLAAMAPAAARPAAGQEWTRFRGPNGTGLSEADPAAIPVQWTEADYNWKVELPGGGHGSPVLWGDRVFLASGVKETGKRIALCLSAADGRTLWARPYDSTKHNMHNLNSYGTTTPAADRDHAYFSWASPDRYAVVAIDHAGAEVWQRDLGPFASEHGHGASLVVHEDLVVVPNDQKGKSFLVALDRKTGRTRWQLERKGGRAAYSTPCVRRPDGRPPELVFTSDRDGITAVDLAAGRVTWEAPDAFPKRVVSSPVLAGDLVIGTCGEGGSGVRLTAVRPGSAPAKPGSAGAAEVAYTIDGRDAPYVPTPLVKGDLLFLLTDGGRLACVRAATGEKLWEEKLEGKFYASPVCVGGRLYAVSTKGEVFVVRAAEKYELLAVNPLGEMSHATPAVAGGRMYLRTFSHLISIGGKK